MNSFLQKYNQERKQKAKQLVLKLEEGILEEDIQAAEALNKNKKKMGKRTHFDYDVQK